MSDAFWVSFFLCVPQILALILTWLSARAAQLSASKANTKVAVVQEKVANLEKSANGNGSHQSSPKIIT